MSLPARFSDPIFRAAVCELIGTAALFDTSDSEQVIAACMLIHLRIAEMVYGDGETARYTDADLEYCLDLWEKLHTMPESETSGRIQ